jgi:hypothetical protein
VFEAHVEEAPSIVLKQEEEKSDEKELYFLSARLQSVIQVEDRSLRLNAVLDDRRTSVNASTVNLGNSAPVMVEKLLRERSVRQKNESRAFARLSVCLA